MNFTIFGIVIAYAEFAERSSAFFALAAYGKGTEISFTAKAADKVLFA